MLPKLASELQLSEKEIQSVLDVYWDKVRKTLSSLEHNRVFIRGLGTFYIKPWAVERQLRLNKGIVDKYTAQPTAGSLTILNNVYKDNLKLNRLLEVEQQRKEEWTKKKNERRNQDLEREG